MELTTLDDAAVAQFFQAMKDMLQADGKVPKSPASTSEFDAFRWNCKQRLVRGQETYGNNSFMHKDLIEETLQEVYDIANYCLMEMVKTNPDHCASVPLGEAVRHAYMAYTSVLDYKRKLRGAP